MTIKLFLMLFLACSLYIAFRVPAESNDPITRHWIFFLWTKKGTNKYYPKQHFLPSNHLLPKAMCWENNHSFIEIPSSWLYSFTFLLPKGEAHFSLESHTGPVLAQGLNIIHILNNTKYPYLTFYLVKNKNHSLS